MVIFLDTNVIFDYFDERKYSKEAKIIFDFCSEPENTGVIASISLATFFYVFRHALTVSERKEDIKMLSTLFSIGSVNRRTISRALSFDMDDYEDAIQLACPEKENAAVIITNNKKDFVKSPIEVLSSLEFVEKFCNKDKNMESK